MFILNIDTTKDWNMLAKPIWVVVKDGVESIDDWILNQWLTNDVKDFKQTMFALIIQWSLNGVYWFYAGVTSAWISGYK